MNQVYWNALALIKELSPWWFKIGAKLALSRLRIPYSRWRKLGIIFSQHGKMLDPDYSLGVFRRHLAEVKTHLLPGFTLMELGPGDSLATAAIASVQGAGKIWLVDIGMFASMEIEAYRPLFEKLAEKEHYVNYLSVAEMLMKTNSTYLIEGLRSLRALRDNTVDWIFSQAVLEHVALDEFEETIGELYRIQRPQGVSSHRIDLQDHLTNNLHSLRFSNAVWESSLFRHSGFYTNRLRANLIVDAFQEAGYRILSRQDDQWPALPLQRTKLHADFDGCSENDSLIRGFHLVVQKS